MANVAGNDVSIKTTLPTGFSLVPGTTKNCITPSIGEKVCNTDAGQGGSIKESTVWVGSSLTISPTAGLYNISPDQTIGILETGKKR